MIKYVALLRAINIGGRNTINMKSLKQMFMDIGFLNVATYINSGNVIFESESHDKTSLIVSINESIKNVFDLDITLTILSFKDMTDIINYAPTWWHDEDKVFYPQMVCMIPPHHPQIILDIIGDETIEDEQVHHMDLGIYWTVPYKNFSKSKLAKIASTKANSKVTIRTARTMKKIYALMQ